jgi:FAD-linked sulfhydryl oxidase
MERCYVTVADDKTQACNSLKAFGAIASGSKPAKSKAASGAGGAAAAAGIASVSAIPTSEDPYKACPPDVEQLGRHTWTFLHTTAAYYPDQPSEQHKKNASALFNSLPSLYPCSFCADELGKEMQRVGPPDVSSRSTLSNWLCNIHNEVNERLGKKQFDCSKVLNRWKDGWDDGRC